MADHTRGDWEFVVTKAHNGDTVYSVKSARFGYVVCDAWGQTDAEALANANRIAKAVTAANRASEAANPSTSASTPQ